MSALKNYIHLLLKHDLKPETKDLIATWIEEEEAALMLRPNLNVSPALSPPYIITSGTQQAPSTMAAMARHEGAVGFVNDTPVNAMAPSLEPPPIDAAMRQKSYEAALRARNKQK